MTLEEWVGEKLVLGIEGKEATASVIEVFRKTAAGGLILFRRNFESAVSVRKLISDLEMALERRVLVFVDHEGGRVIQFGEGVTLFPDAQAAGESGRVDWVRRQGEIEALELRRLGIDVNLAPILDVLTQTWNPAIGTRSYGKDPEKVAAMGKARIEGMQSKGLSACAKHFPGIGRAALDPHDELPRIQSTWKEIKKQDLLPFVKAFEAQVDCVMSSHPVYPELDPDRRRPATFSRRLIHDLLRLELGFSGVALTDDLRMGAIAKTASIREAAPLAVQAGHDLLLICSEGKAQQEAFDALLWAYKKKELKISELEESAERIRKLRERRTDRFLEGKPAPEKEGADLASQIAREGAKVLGTGRGLLPLSPAWCLSHSLLAIFPDLREIARERLWVEPELLEPENFLRKKFGQFGIPLKGIESVSLDPKLGERAKIRERVREEDLVFFLCSDAHLFPGTRELLKSLQEISQRFVVILMKEPHDFDWILPGTACVAAYGFRASQIEAAIEKCFSV